jgi:hypothetical protein
MFKLKFIKVLNIWGTSIILATALLSTSVLAIDKKVQLTGKGFSDACTRADESWISFCNGYIQAVIDSIREDDKVCLPVGTTRTDIVTIVEKDITASTDLQAMNAHDAVLSVLRSYYPCR